MYTSSHLSIPSAVSPFAPCHSTNHGLPWLPFRYSINRVYFRTFSSTGSTFLHSDQPCLSPHLSVNHIALPAFASTMLTFPPFFSPIISLFPPFYSIDHLYFRALPSNMSALPDLSSTMSSCPPFHPTNHIHFPACPYPLAMSTFPPFHSTMSIFPPSHSINHNYPPALHPTNHVYLPGLPFRQPCLLFPLFHLINHVYSHVYPTTNHVYLHAFHPTMSTCTPFRFVNRVSFLFSRCSSASTTRTRSTCRSTSARGRPAPSAANSRRTRSEKHPNGKKSHDRWLAQPVKLAARTREYCVYIFFIIILRRVGITAPLQSRYGGQIT